MCWPHMIIEIQKGNFVNFFSKIVAKTLSWIDGPKIGLINGEIYEIFNTPKTYFLDENFLFLNFNSAVIILDCFKSSLIKLLSILSNSSLEIIATPL